MTEIADDFFQKDQVHFFFLQNCSKKWPRDSLLSLQETDSSKIVMKYSLFCVRIWEIIQEDTSWEIIGGSSKNTCTRKIIWRYTKNFSLGVYCWMIQEQQKHL